MKVTIRIPPIDRCALSSKVNEETNCAELTLGHWHMGQLIQVTEALPENYPKLGYYARKSVMQGVVRKIQVELARRMQELSEVPCRTGT